MADLREDHLEALSTLKHHVGFAVLVELLKVQEQTILDEMYLISEPQEFVRVGYMWKAYHGLAGQIETSPEAAIQELEKIRERELDTQET